MHVYVTGKVKNTIELKNRSILYFSSNKMVNIVIYLFYIYLIGTETFRTCTTFLPNSRFPLFFKIKECKFSQLIANFMKWELENPQISPVTHKINSQSSAICRGIKPHSFINRSQKNSQSLSKNH